LWICPKPSRISKDFLRRAVSNGQWDQNGDRSMPNAVPRTLGTNSGSTMDSNGTKNTVLERPAVQPHLPRQARFPTPSTPLRMTRRFWLSNLFIGSSTHDQYLRKAPGKIIWGNPINTHSIFIKI
jgi:hypothetical protein